MNEVESVRKCVCVTAFIFSASEDLLNATGKDADWK